MKSVNKIKMFKSFLKKNNIKHFRKKHSIIVYIGDSESNFGLERLFKGTKETIFYTWILKEDLNNRNVILFQNWTEKNKLRTDNF